MKKILRKLNTPQIIALGFAGVIFVGGLILWLPVCAAEGCRTSFTDAMFTAATSTCVTGLTTVTTASHWSAFGKIIIFLLIQIGGIGVISIATIIFAVLHKRIGLRSRRIIKESYNLSEMEGMVRLVRRIVLCVFGAEAAGAFFYCFRFVPEYGWGRGILYSVFTSVSAFCNAGIDILGDGSLAPYVKDPLVNLITIGLVILSGLGFTVWWDLAKNVRRAFHRELSPGRIFGSLRLHSKIVLEMTAGLVVVGTVLIFLFEYQNPSTMKNLSLGEKLMASLFQSVTTRTAGFFTVPQGGLSSASVIMCLIWMFIGGSPMGTAGGVKTTTVAVMALAAMSNLRGRRDIEVHHRRIRNTYVRSAVVVLMMGLLVVLLSSTLLAVIMPEASLADILYEAVSAAATVGLSRGLTGMLPAAGKWVVILTMYLGRIGPITLGTAVLSAAQQRTDKTSLAAEDMMIG